MGEHILTSPIVIRAYPGASVKRTILAWVYFNKYDMKLILGDTR